MTLDPRFVTICRMAGLAEWRDAPLKATLALHRMGGATLAESDFLVQVVYMCRDQPVVWGIIEESFIQLVKGRPELGVYFTLAKETAAKAAKDQLRRDRN